MLPGSALTGEDTGSAKSNDTTKSDGGIKRKKKKKIKKDTGAANAATEQANKEQKPKDTSGKCNLCDLPGHFGRDCPQKAIAKAALKKRWPKRKSLRSLRRKKTLRDRILLSRGCKA